MPPPMPVLPDSEAALLPSAGRRFSASAEPGEVVYAAPRRSAVSANSPTSAREPILPPPVRPTAPPSTTVNVTPFSKYYPQSVPTAPTAPPDAPSLTPPAPLAVAPVAAAALSEEAAEPKSEPATKAKKARREKAPRPVKERRSKAEAEANTTDASTRRKRSAKPAMVIIAAVGAVAVLVAASVWALTVRSFAPSGGPSTTTAAALDPLMTAADLAGLAGATWSDSADPVRPLCLPEAADGLPAAQRSVSRRITSSTSTTEAVAQVVDTYADDAAATQAYAARLTQTGTCAEAVAWITGANTISGLADSADLVRLTVQEEQVQFHSLLVARTGRNVSMIDIGTSVAVPAAEVANLAAKPLSRQCSGGEGTCPGSIAVSTAPPPPGNPVGWLVSADLPRITAGAGRWGATEPQTTLNVVGSQCEAMNLKTVPGTQKVGQRTLLLADDGAAPEGFGVDQVVYTFADATAAESLAKKLETNLSGCPDRAPTASVKAGPAVKGTGAAKVKIAGYTFKVTQRTETNTVVFRVAVLTVGQRLVYLLANPSATFDFSDDSWGRVAVRSGQRVSQTS